MANDHVATPFREILASIIKPVEYPISVSSHRQEFKTRFHPDDLSAAFSVLAIHLGLPETPEDWNRYEQAWKHAILSLEADIQRRDDDELDAQYRYEQAREERDRQQRAAWIKSLERDRLTRFGSTEIHDSDIAPKGAF